MAYSNINKPNEYFNTRPYTGDGNSSQAITGVGFAPDFVWIKKRTGGAATGHKLLDTVRGNNLAIESSSTDAELENTVNPNQTSFDSDGFTTGNNGGVNLNGSTYVSWNWLAGGTASSNTDGSITSTVSANTTAGFSIVSYTGTASAQTVGHGLGTTPSMIIVKNRDAAENWGVWHNLLDADEYLGLNQTNAIAVNTAIWNNTLPTSNVFSVGNNARTGSSADFIAYCFAEKKGFSEFGSYRGNGSTDGTFIYTGFKPAYFMIKRTDTTGSWIIHDNKRSFYNVTSNDLYANLSDLEVSGNRFDFVSNGVKLRNNFTNMNASGGIYIYMAFAESPLVAGNYVPTTAR